MTVTVNLWYPLAYLTVGLVLSLGDSILAVRRRILEYGPYPPGAWRTITRWLPRGVWEYLSGVTIVAWGLIILLPVVWLLEWWRGRR